MGRQKFILRAGFVAVLSWAALTSSATKLIPELKYSSGFLAHYTVGFDLDRDGRWQSLLRASENWVNAIAPKTYESIGPVNVVTWLSTAPQNLPGYLYRKINILTKQTDYLDFSTADPDPGKSIPGYRNSPNRFHQTELCIGLAIMIWIVAFFSSAKTLLNGDGRIYHSPHLIILPMVLSLVIVLLGEVQGRYFIFWAVNLPWLLLCYNDKKQNYANSRVIYPALTLIGIFGFVLLVAHFLGNLGYRHLDLKHTVQIETDPPHCRTQETKISNSAMLRFQIANSAPCHIELKKEIANPEASKLSFLLSGDHYAVIEGPWKWAPLEYSVEINAKQVASGTIDSRKPHHYLEFTISRDEPKLALVIKLRKPREGDGPPVALRFLSLN